ncbi:MAG: glucosaminidase domain-containing protein [Bacteroidales bacterium]|nr:glucosaminidase domain-containing protein [Bacteroidales bacterium]
MKHLRNSIIALMVILCSLSARGQYTEYDIYAYIDTYKELAINKMYEYKIPASITIAQGIFESACGKSHLAVDGNNHFGIKCHKDWTGDTILIDDDELQECFRKYERVEESYTDHSLFLKNRQRYAALFTLDIMDYPGWARGLKAAGYATNPQYADRLISIIERFHIAYLDTLYQQRLQAGYFKNYPEMHPELMVDFSYVNQYAQPQPTAMPQPAVAEKPAESAQPVTAHPTSTSQPTPTKPHSNKINSEKVRTKPSHKKNPPKSSTPPANHQNPEPKPTNNTQPAKATDPKSSAPKQEQQPAQSAATATPTQPTVFTAKKGDFTPYAGYPFTEREVYVNNNTLFIIAEEGDTYAQIARDVQLPEKKIKKFNDLSGAANPQPGEVVYIEKKAKTGERPTYTVQDQENPRYIAQMAGIQLQKLCDYNGINAETQLKKGRIIKLK